MPTNLIAALIVSTTLVAAGAGMVVALPGVIASPAQMDTLR